MKERISYASTGDQPRESSNARSKRTQQQPIRLEDEKMGEKKSNEDRKSLKDDSART